MHRHNVKELPIQNNSAVLAKKSSKQRSNKIVVFWTIVGL